MEYNFNNDEFKQLLKDEVEDQTMYPSEHVWENIRVELHGQPAWPALTLSAVLIIFTLIIFTVYNYPPTTIALKSNTIVKKSSQIITDNNEISLSNNKENTSISKSIDEHINPAYLTQNTFDIIHQNNLDNEPVIAPTNQFILSKKLTDASPIKTSLKLTRLTTSIPEKITQHVTPYNIDLEENKVTADAINQSYSNSTDSPKSKYAQLLHATLNNSSESDPTIDAYLNDFAYKPITKAKRRNRFEFQVYATPSISYRNLSDDKTRVWYQPYTTANNLVQNLSTNINNIVKHTPALGFELGLGVWYKLTPTLKIRTGLQFNIRQYYIDAYQSFGVATIAIVQNYRLDSVKYFSMFSNSSNNSSLSTKIDNKLYQVSIPIGIQWDFINGKKLGLSMGASIQPTFTLNKNVYVISTDYKNYTNGAPFFRKWNLNTSAELDVTYKIGNVKWYFGPQIRYQHFPTYNDVYPIKEYRLDYGLKLGFTTPLFK